jgi:hypothetical protein
MWQLGVRARLRLLQDDWPAAERDARAVLAAGKFPLGRLWPRLVLGVLAARRDAPPDNPDLDELWCLVDRIDNLGKIAPAAAALAEQAWILRRPDPRLTDARVGALLSRTAEGGPATLQAWPAGWPGRACRTSARWSTGRWRRREAPTSRSSRTGTRTPRRPCSRRCRCWTTSVRAPSGRCSAAGSASWA